MTRSGRQRSASGALAAARRRAERGRRHSTSAEPTSAVRVFFCSFLLWPGGVALPSIHISS